MDLHSPHEEIPQTRAPRVPGRIDTELACIVSFDGAGIGRLELSGLRPEWDATQFRLNDLTYSSVAAPGGGYAKQVPWMEHAFLGRADLVPGAYARYTAFLNEQGYPSLSDEIFLAGKDRERLAARSHFATLPKYFGGLALYLSVQYGKQPAQAFAIGGIIVLVGTLIFRTKMKRAEPVTEADHYNPFWYSLDLFAPVIELGSAKEWLPAEHPRWRWHYMRLRRLLGWILVPIGVAALIGIVK